MPAINMQDELSRLPGVGNVVIFGTGTYAMRVWLDPQKMLAYSLNPSEVLEAISHQNQEISSGQIGAPPSAGTPAYQFTVNVPGQLADVEQFSNIIVKTIAQKPNQSATSNRINNSAQIVRIRDIGRVELGSNSYNQLAKLNQ
ncbi:multidrug efflux pump [Legionella sainthelensi]|nr:efflux RND transporter permease subunit [Legionella sainthelensi]VEB39438.1 multidrug efflux pump [Legionella sainthelensi]